MRRLLSLLALTAAVGAAEVVVGPGRGLLRVEDGFKALKAGDTLVIHPAKDGKPYEGVALRVTLPEITIRGVGDPADGGRVVLSGAGFDYSGAGPVPRAIIEFAPEARGGRVENLRLTGARNQTGNGAGVRINAANGVTISDCEIDGNDMGVMSNGRHDQMRDLLIEACHLHGNGANDHEGMSHNLYLGGASARLRGCLIERSADGHNLKSRTHTLLVEGCTIRDSANREADLVDAQDVTDRPGSLALFLGCLIAKDPQCAGNRGVIHFGQDGGADHRGAIWLIHCTVVTPFQSPVIELSAPSARANLVNDVIIDPSGGGSTRRLIGRRGPGPDQADVVAGLWLPYGYDAGPDAKGVITATLNQVPPVLDDGRPREDASNPLLGGGIPLDQTPLPLAALTADHPLRQRPLRLVLPGEDASSREGIPLDPPDLGAFVRTRKD